MSKTSKLYLERIALAICTHKLVQHATKKSVVEGLLFYLRTECVEVFSTQNPCLVLSLMLATEATDWRETWRPPASGFSERR